MEDISSYDVDAVYLIGIIIMFLQVKRLVEPVRDLFVVFFFASIGKPDQYHALLVVQNFANDPCMSFNHAATKELVQLVCRVESDP